MKAENAEDAGALHGLIDRLAAEFAEPPHRDEIAAARAAYFERSGKVFEDDGEVFESRLASFLEWYVIERSLAGGPPPVLRALARALGDGSGEDAGALARLAASHHALFQVTVVVGARLMLEDVLGGGRFVAVERRSTIGFEAGDLFEGRLIRTGSGLAFGKTFLFHPRDARDVALDRVETGLAAGQSHDDILFQLARLHVRWHRQGHGPAARVYRGV